MSRKLRIIRDIVLPAVLIVVLLGFLTGCIIFPVPWFEHRLSTDPNPRAFVGQAGSKYQIQPGKVTRDEVISILGTPQYASANQRSLIYIERTGVGYWTGVICFFPIAEDIQKTYAVRLDFDAHDRLVSYKWDASFDGQNSLINRLKR